MAPRGPADIYIYIYIYNQDSQGPGLRAAQLSPGGARGDPHGGTTLLALKSTINLKIEFWPFGLEKIGIGRRRFFIEVIKLFPGKFGI